MTTIQQQFTCTKRLEFDAAHRVRLHGGKCRSLHGHRYAAEFTCTASVLLAEGFVIDFGVVKRIVGEWIDEHLDHTTIFERNDMILESFAFASHRIEGLKPFFIMQKAPTAENLAELLYHKAEGLLAAHSVRVLRVRVYETPTCWADFEWVPVKVPDATQEES